MSLESTIVGLRVTESVVASGRWMMAFAASVGATGSHYLDTSSEEGIQGHPLFPVALEWPAMLALGSAPEAQNLTDMERARNVHGAIDLHLIRPIRPDMHLGVAATVVLLEQRGNNTYQVVKVECKDHAGDVYCRSFQTGIFLGTSLTGSARAIETPPATPIEHGAADQGRSVISLSVPDGAGQIYSECARIWNPIHSDRKEALAAGLPGVILHGTATFAMAVTQLVDRLLGGDPARVSRLGCQFRGMVRQPSMLSVNYGPCLDNQVGFDVLTESEDLAIKKGYMVFRPKDDPGHASY